jgi:hypothetical protein
MLYNCIREVLHSNLGQDDGYSDKDSLKFSPVLSGKGPQLGNGQFLPNPFQFVSHPTIGYTVV